MNAGASVSDALSRAADALMVALTEIGNPLPEHLRPGLTDSEIDELVQTTNLTFPEEARALWRWADGAKPDESGGSAFATSFPGGLVMQDLASATSFYLDHLETFPWEDIPEQSPQWFRAFICGRDDYWLDTRVPDDAPCPLIRIYSADTCTPEELAEQTVPSITEAFTQMRVLVTSGGWSRLESPRTPPDSPFVYWGITDDADVPPWM